MDANNDVDILARTIYGEAEAHNEKDAFAIANVVMNRVKYGLWPNTVSSVCLQPYQFSCWDNSDPNRQRIVNADPSEPWFLRCNGIASRAILRSRSDDPTKTATHYHTHAVSPYWSKDKRPCYQTTGHVFYNDVDTPAPVNAREALAQDRPLKKSRTMKGGVVATTGGSVAAFAGALTSLKPALPVLNDLTVMFEENLPAIMIGVGGIVFLSAAYMMYVRYDDRQKGKR